MAQEAHNPMQNYLIILHQNLIEHFSDDELRTLCFDLQVEYDDLPGQGRASKARELIVFLRRRDRIPELIELCAKLRPTVEWQGILEAARQAIATYPGGIGDRFPASSFFASARQALLGGWHYAAIGVAVIVIVVTVVLVSQPFKAAPPPVLTPTATIAPPTATSAAVSPAFTPEPTSTPVVTPILGSGKLYNVAIAKIDDRLASTPVEIAGRLQDDLQEALRSYKLDRNVAVKVVPQVVQSEDEAVALAATTKSSVVIWGLYDSMGIRLRIFLGAETAGPTESEVIRMKELPLGMTGSETGTLSFIVHEVLPENMRFLSLYVIGHLYYLANNYAEGYKAFDAATANLPSTVQLENEALLHFFNARSIQQKAATPRIITDTHTIVCEYARAIQLDSKMFEAYNNLGVLMTDLEPESYSREPCVKAASISSLYPSDLFSQALQIRPDWALAQYNLVAEEWSRGGVEPSDQAPSIKPFREKFQHILMLDSTIPGAHIALGNLSIWDGDFVGAADHFQKALRLWKSAKVAVNLGQAWALAGQNEQALAAYRQALAIDPDDTEAGALAHLATGNLYHRQGDLTRANEEYQQAQRLSSGQSYGLELAQVQYDLEVAQAKYAIDTGAWLTATELLGPIGPIVNLQTYLRWLTGIGVALGQYKLNSPVPHRSLFFSWTAAWAAGMTWSELEERCGVSDARTWGSVANPCLPADPKAREETVYKLFQTRVHYILFFNRVPLYGIGACPYIFTYDDQRADWSFDTTILYKLVGPQAKMLQERPLARFDGHLLVREVEPETSYIDMLYVRLITAEGRELELYPNESLLAQDDGRYLILHQGDERLLKFNVPDGVMPVRQAWVVASGYYIPHGD